MSETERLVCNALLSLAFFLQHSGMIRRPFRRRIDVLIPSNYQGALYTVVSGLVLLAFVAFWQDSDIILLEVHGVPGVAMRVFYVLSILGMCWGSWALRSVDMFGLDPILKCMQAKPSQPMPFTIGGLTAGYGILCICL